MPRAAALRRPAEGTPETLVTRGKLTKAASEAFSQLCTFTEFTTPGRDAKRTGKGKSFFDSEAPLTLRIPANLATRAQLLENANKVLSSSWSGCFATSPTLQQKQLSLAQGTRRAPILSHRHFLLHFVHLPPLRTHVFNTLTRGRLLSVISVRRPLDHVYQASFDVAQHTRARHIAGTVKTACSTERTWDNW